MKWLIAVLALFAAAHPASAQADTYPSRTVKIVVPFPAGGGTDLVVRHFVERLRQRLNQSIVIENSGGGGGNPATGVVARSQPDGYTLVGQTDQLAFTSFFTPNLPYDLFRDFVPISFLAKAPVVVAVNPALPAQTLAEFLALAREKPSTLHYATPGIGTSHHLGGELLAHAAKVSIVHVPYRGATPALNDVIAGHVQVAVFSLGITLPQAKAGKLRILGVMSDKRSDLAPEYPTFAESGLPGVEVLIRCVLMAPANTPAEIVARLNKEVVEIAKEREVAASLRQLGWEPMSSSPEETMETMRKDHERWREIIKAAAIKTQ